MPEKKVRETIRVGSYDLDKYVPDSGSGRRSDDPLDAMMVEEGRRMLNEAKTLRLKKYISDLKKELGEESSAATAAGKASSEVSPDMMRYIMDMPEDKRQETMAVYFAFRNAERAALGGKSDGGSWLLPLMIGWQRNNPNAPQGSLENYAKIVTDQIRLGMEMAKQGAPAGVQASYNPMELVKTIMEYTTKESAKAIDEIVKKIQPAPSPLEAIIMDDGLFNRAKTLGMFGGQMPAVTDGQAAAQLQQMKQDHDLKMAEFQRDNQRWEFDMREKQIGEARKLNLVRDIFGLGQPGGDSPFAKIISGLGDAAVRRVTPEQSQNMSAGAVSARYQAMCSKCSGVFLVDRPEGTVECPHCGEKLTIGEGGGVDDEVEGGDGSTGASQG